MVSSKFINALLIRWSMGTKKTRNVKAVNYFLSLLKNALGF